LLKNGNLHLSKYDEKGKMFLSTEVRQVIFLEEFPEFKYLEMAQVDQLIELYDNNISAVRDLS
jgi:hypothetical protein